MTQTWNSCAMCGMVYPTPGAHTCADDAMKPYPLDAFRVHPAITAAAAKLDREIMGDNGKEKPQTHWMISEEEWLAGLSENARQRACIDDLLDIVGYLPHGLAILEKHGIER